MTTFNQGFPQPGTLQDDGMCSHPEGCDRQAATRGWCRKHYSRWYYKQGGRELATKYGPRNETPLERAMRQIEKDPETGCWNKTSGLMHGYGTVRVGKVKVYMHRLTYEKFIGPIPDGYWIDHLCRNPRCCNPEHLEAVLPAENFRRGARWNPNLEAQPYA